MTLNVLLLPYCESKKILFLCPLILYMGGYAFFLELYDLCCLNCFIFITSINHWKYPVHNSYRQWLDRISIVIGCFYELHKSIQYNIPLYVYIPMICGIYCYYKALHMSRINKTVSAHWHCGLHLCICLYHFILYTFLSIYNNFIK
jgi:hypothetical protein